MWNVDDDWVSACRNVEVAGVKCRGSVGVRAGRMCE